MNNRMLFTTSLLLFFCVSPAGARENPVPVNVLDGERYDNRTLTLLQSGEIVYAPDKHTIIGKDGTRYSVRAHNTFTTVKRWNPSTKKDEYYRECTGTTLTAAQDGMELYTRSFSGCMKDPAFSVRDGKITAVLMESARLFGHDAHFVLEDGKTVLVKDVPLGVAVSEFNEGYYMLSLGSMNGRLEVTVLNRELKPVRTHVIDKHASSPHIAVDAAGNPHISFYDSKSKVLKYARMEGGGFVSYELDTPDSGAENSIDVDEQDVVISSYFIRNTYYKGISVYRVPLKGDSAPASFRRCVLVVRKNENLGWTPTVSTNGSELAVSAYNRTSDKTEVFRVSKDYIQEVNDSDPPEIDAWMKEQKKLKFYLDFGYDYIRWRTRVRTGGGDLTGTVMAPGSYSTEPSFLEDVSFGGEYEGTSFAFEYMRDLLLDKYSEDASDGERRISEHIAGQIGVDDLIGHEKTLELHTRTGKFQGTYDNAGVRYDFESRYFDMDIDIFSRRGFSFFGLGYRNYETPQPVILSQNNMITEEYVTTADFDIYSVLIGFSNLNYLRQYENKYSGFYLDGKAYLGFANIDLEREPSVAHKSSSPIVVRAAADMGYMTFHRMESLRHLGYFIKAGLLFDYSFIYAREGKADEDTAATEATVNINRRDYFRGLFIKAGLVF